MKYIKLAIVLLLNVLTPYALAYDGTVVLSNGQTLYYYYENSSHAVYITYPGTQGSPWQGGYPKPSGAIVIPDSITHDGIKYPVIGILDNAFDNCNNITSVVIPDGVTYIGNAAFVACTHLTTVVIGNGVTTIGNPNSLGSSIFQYCFELTSVRMGSNVNYIDATAFDGCYKLNTVTIGDNTLNVTSNDTTLGKTYITFPCILSWDHTLYVWTYDIAAHHHVVWSNGSTLDNTAITLTNDMDLVANFVPERYTLNVTVNDTAFGSVFLPAGDTADYGDTLLVLAQPSAHHHTVSWYGATLVSDNKDTTWVRMTADCTLTCNFAIDTHTITLQPDIIARGSVSGSGNYQYGTAATVYALPYSGYLFSHWSDGSTYNPYTFAVLDDIHLTAYFYCAGMPYQDTIVLHDTVYVDVHDTTYINVPYAVHDTLLLTDTLWQYDTVTIVDTVYITHEGVSDVDEMSVKVYSSCGQIVVEGANGNTVSLFDTSGRVLATMRSDDTSMCFPIPSTGTYMIKIGNLSARKLVVMR